MTQRLFIPQPVSLHEENGLFRLPKQIAVILPTEAGADDLFAAQTLQRFLGEYSRTVGTLEKRCARDTPRKTITLLRADRDVAWLPANLPELQPQGYYLHIDATGVLLVGADAPGLLYGVYTLGQLLDQQESHLPALTICDHPALPVRGVMLDVSRGKVPTVETLLEVVDLLASWKINQFQLYIEHTFHWPSHPKIGKSYSPLTAEDILIIDEACTQRHIDFVPNLQSFGHQGHLLRLREYAHLAETKMRWTLSPAEPGTYQLLDKLYSEFLPNFRSCLFNVDSDETFDLGKGKTAPMVAEKGLGRVYLDHIMRLRELAGKHGRRMMFWGDIVLHHPELIPEIPDDVIVLQWQYDDEPSEEDVRKFAKGGKQFYVCPGTNSWVSLFPRQRMARSNIAKMVAYGVKYGASGVLNTDWGDGGHYNMQGLSYYGYAFGAAESWHPGSTEHFDTAFGRLFFGRKYGDRVMEAMQALEKIEKPLPHIQINDVIALHMDFLAGKVYRETLTSQAADIIAENARHGVNILRKLRGRTRQPLVIQELFLAAYQDYLFAEKAKLAIDFHQRYTKVYATNNLDDLEQLVRDIRPKLRRLAGQTEKVPYLFAPLWRARARENELRNVIEFQLAVPTDLLASADWLNGALRRARRGKFIPRLPDISERWEPRVQKLQMGG